MISVWPTRRWDLDKVLEKLRVLAGNGFSQLQAWITIENLPLDSLAFCAGGRGSPDIHPVPSSPLHISCLCHPKRGKQNDTALSIVVAGPGRLSSEELFLSNK